MPPDSPNEQELMLKKRARRRLVGAIALVLLMIVVLPQVLQDRAVIAQQDPIKITMSEPASSQQLLANESVIHTSQTQDVSNASTLPIEALPANVADTTHGINDANAIVKSADLEKNLEKKVVAKTNEVVAPPHVKEKFTVQVGVYSDLTNVARLQDQLKQAGFSSNTEKLTSEKGEVIRLKAGSFHSRQDAMLALAKIKEIGLPGIVVAQE